MQCKIRMMLNAVTLVPEPQWEPEAILASIQNSWTLIVASSDIASLAFLKSATWKWLFLMPACLIVPSRRFFFKFPELKATKSIISCPTFSLSWALLWKSYNLDSMALCYISYSTVTESTLRWYWKRAEFGENHIFPLSARVGFENMRLDFQNDCFCGYLQTIVPFHCSHHSLSSDTYVSRLFFFLFRCEHCESGAGWLLFWKDIDG